MFKLFNRPETEPVYAYEETTYTPTDRIEVGDVVVQFGGASKGPKIGQCEVFIDGKKITHVRRVSIRVAFDEVATVAIERCILQPAEAEEN
jgi:hypothetical protein